MVLKEIEVRSDKTIKCDWRKNFKLTLTSLLFGIITSFIGITCKIRYFNYDAVLSWKDKKRTWKQSWICCCWHQNVAICVWLFRFSQATVLVSESRDGEAITRAIRSFSIKSIRGSSNLGGGRGLILMAKKMKLKNIISFMFADGSNGPLYKLKAGTVMLGKKTGAPIVPFYVSADRAWKLEKSWDHHMIPKPFSTIIIRAGNPIYVADDLPKEQIETVRLEMEQAMVENMAEVNRIVETMNQNKTSS